MLNIALAEESAKPGDRVFVIVPKQKISSSGRRFSSRSEKELEVIKAAIDQIHLGWSWVKSAYSWSCSLTQIVEDDAPLNGRYISELAIEDCFYSESEALQELQKRVSAV